MPGPCWACDPRMQPEVVRLVATKGLSGPGNRAVVKLIA